jgi:glucokinase
MPLDSDNFGLVADIGGTNARFALARRGAHGTIQLKYQREMATQDHASLAACLEAYLRGLGPTRRPDRAAFGVAGPVTGDLIQLTNRDWSFSIEGLKRAFNLNRLDVVNDFSAIGHAVGALSGDDWAALPGPPWPDQLAGVLSIIGPGTGLGVCARIRTDNGPEVVIASEGGHASFAPVDDIEIEILKIMLGKFTRVSNERILSGPGLGHLYEALSQVRGQSVTSPGTPAILEAALGGSDDLAVEAVERFCLILGSAMGDVALVQGAAAVAIAGGMVARMADFLNAAAVRARFEAKGRSRHLLATVPIALIRHAQPGLLGAANLLLCPTHVQEPAQ